MATDAQTLVNTSASEGYDKLSKKDLIEALLAAVGKGGGGGASLIDWQPPNLKFFELVGFMTVGSGGSWPGITDVTFKMNHSLTGFFIQGAVDVQHLSWPNLVDVDPSNVNGGYILISVNPALLTISFTSLTSIGLGLTLTIASNPLLTTIDLPVLVTSPLGFSMPGNTNLTTLNIPQFVPTDGTTLNIQGGALSATSVEQLLRRCVLAGVTTCTINLAGGTNAGLASLNAQGQADAATLGAQLAINP